MAIIKNLTCFKCHNDTARLTYEEERTYKVSCPCGCEYTFQHCSMDDAEAYHLRMVELYGEIDKNAVLRRQLAEKEIELKVIRNSANQFKQWLARVTAERDALTS